MQPSSVRGIGALTLAAVAVSVALLHGGVRAQVRSDETVVFFPVAAALDEEHDLWRATLHGWIMELEEDSMWRHGTVAALTLGLGLDHSVEGNAIFRRRARWLLADDERAKQVHVRLAGQEIVLDPSGPDGHFRSVVELPAAMVDRLIGARGCQGCTLSFEAILDSDDDRSFSGEIALVQPHGLGVISDIDDTVKISHVRDTHLLLEHTLVREFEIVPGMPELYRRWQRLGASFAYVSSSPWQLWPEISAAFDAAGLPRGEPHLKRLRIKDDSLLDLWKDPLESKPPVIAAILERFPGRRFLLVGDSGESDPEVYGIIARAHPRQVAGIFIRDVTGEGGDCPRMQSAFADLPPALWQVFVDPGEIAFGRPREAPEPGSPARVQER